LIRLKLGATSKGIPRKDIGEFEFHQHMKIRGAAV
jgi:hypothetical protein